MTAQREPEPMYTGSPIHSSAAARLAGEKCAGCEIHRARDDCGHYVLWAWWPGAGGIEWGLLSHEDGAPLRFATQTRARAHARRCGFPARDVTLRWPP